MARPISRSGKVPLERALSKLGIASRSQTRQWVLAGRIRVDDVVCREPDVLVTPEISILKLDGRVLRRPSFRLVLMHKPRGVVTTRSDEKGRPTIFSLLSPGDQNLHAVGRLDMATSGLLLLTNNTRLSHWLTDPPNKVPRIYTVTVQGEITARQLAGLKAGIEDEGELLAAEEVVLRKSSRRESHLTVTLTEGKNREIRRMFEALGHGVTRLKRVAFGPLTLGTLPLGQTRDVSWEEIRNAFPQAPLPDGS